MSFSLSRLSFSRIFDSSILPGIPTNFSVVPADAQIIVSFSSPSFNGGSKITDYEYSTDNGATFKSANTITSPFTITTVSSGPSSLINDTLYNVKIRAININGAGIATSSIAVTPTSIPSLTNIALLRSASTPYQTNGNVINIQGYYNLGDDGGSNFQFSSSTLVSDDSATVIRPNNIGSGSPGRWIRMFPSKYACVEMWGARGNGNDDDAKFIQAAIDYVSLSGAALDYTLNFNSKAYFLSSYNNRTTPGYKSFLSLGDFADREAQRYRHSLNLIGSTNTMLCASNIFGKTQLDSNYSTVPFTTWENGVKTVNTNRAMITVVNAVTGLTIKKIKLFNDGYNTASTGYRYITNTGQISSNPNGQLAVNGAGISITSGTEFLTYDGGRFYGFYSPDDRWNKKQYVNFHDCTWINLLRTHNISCAFGAGSGIQVLSITGCNYLYPYGCSSNNSQGGSQTIYVTIDTKKFIFDDNDYEGTSYIPARCDNSLPVDGPIVGIGIESYIRRNIFKRSSVETIVPNVGLPQINLLDESQYPPGYWNPNMLRMPAVNQSTTFKILDYNIASIIALTASFFDVNQIFSIGPNYAYNDGTTGGIFRVNSWTKDLGPAYNDRFIFYVNVTRVSGAEYGGAAAVSKDVSVGTCLSARYAIAAFNFTKTYGQKCHILDNVFAAGVSVSADKADLVNKDSDVVLNPYGFKRNRPSHDPVISNTSGFSMHVSGNQFEGGTGIAAYGSSTNYGVECIIENNNFYWYNQLPRLNGPSYLTPVELASAIPVYPFTINVSLSNTIIRNNKWYAWIDANTNLTTKLNSAFPMPFYNCSPDFPNFTPSNPSQPYTPVRFLGATFDYGSPTPVDGSFYNNTFYCTIPLSAHLIVPVGYTFASGKTIFNNTLVNIVP